MVLGKQMMWLDYKWSLNKMEQKRKRKGIWSERKKKRREYETLETGKVGHQISSIPNLFQRKLH